MTVTAETADRAQAVWDDGALIATVLNQCDQDARRTIHVDCGTVATSWQCDPTRGEGVRWTVWSAEGPAGEGPTPLDAFGMWWGMNAAVPS